MTDTIRLFIGAAANGEDLESQMVAEYSARQHCSLPLEITWMQQAAKGPYSGWKCGSGRTPFTHFRWSLPAMCQFDGKAIYTDVDFIYRADLAELWNQPVPGVFLAKVGKKGLGKTCCLLFDCAHAKGHVPTLDQLRRMDDPQGTLMKYFREWPALTSNFAGDWNAIDLKGYDDIADPRIKAIHYSRIEMQPSFPYAQKRLKAEGKAHWYTGPTGPHERPELIALFDQLYREALASGYTLDQYRVGAFAGATRKNFTYSHSRVVPA
jgi:hypothetical protein